MATKGILLAVNQQKLIDWFITKQNSDYDILGTIRTNDSIMDGVRKYHPEILFVTEGLESSTQKDVVPLLVNIKKEFPSLRIIFLAGEVDISDTYGLNRLGKLAEEGIYDIYYDKKLNSAILTNLLEKPRSVHDVEHLLRDRNIHESVAFDFEEENTNTVRQGYENISVFTSIKPGSGKSFISTNVATAVAKWGKRKQNGNYPKVAIIEGDLQTLSVGTLLQLDDRERNLNNALKIVANVINEDGEIIGSDAEIEQAKNQIKNCFLKCYHVDNLYALVSSQLTLGDLNGINPSHFYFLVELMASVFDVIIMDTNSSLEHRTSGSALDLAENCFYILDLDYNNITNNVRYRQTLKSIGVMDKVRYILNKDIPDYMQENFAEKLEYTAENLNTNGFELVAKVPMIDTTVVYNRAKRGVPLILDKTQDSLNARKELFKIADKVYPIDVFSDLKAEIDEYNNPKKTKKAKQKKEKSKGLFRKKN